MRSCLKKKKIKTFIKKNNLKYYKIEESIIEDIQITNRMKYYKIGKLPDFDPAKEFSLENINTQTF